MHSSSSEANSKISTAHKNLPTALFLTTNRKYRKKIPLTEKIRNLKEEFIYYLLI